MKFFNKNITCVLCIIFCSAFFCACENDINEVKALSNKGVNSEEVYDVESYLSVGGKVQARLTAPIMISSEKDTTRKIFPKTLHVIFYDDSTGLPSSFLFAKYGVYYQSLKKVFLRDSVIGTNIGGDTLRTNELWWDQNTQQIYSSVPTVMIQSNPYSYTPGQNGFRSKQDFSDFVFNDVNNGIFPQDSTTSF